MDKIPNSDMNPTMIASRTFDSILQQIQLSNLNFQLQISPFSANISLKKTPIKDKYGALLLPPSPMPLWPSTRSSPASCCASLDVNFAALAAKNLQLEKELVTLRKDLVNSVDESEAAHQKIKFLENLSSEKSDKIEDLKNEISKKNVLVSTLKLEMNQLSQESDSLRTTAENLSGEIEDLESLNKKGRQASDKLNKIISEMKTKFTKEKETMSKEHGSEVKALRKELGEVTKHKIKLEDQVKQCNSNLKAVIEKAKVCDVDSNQNFINLKSSETSSLDTKLETEDCTICAEPIPDYKPSLFNGIEMNPACESCKEFSSDTEAHSEETANPIDSPFLDNNSLASTSLATTSLASTSLATTSLATTSSASTSIDTTSLNLILQDARNIPSEKTSRYVREPWKCDLCEFTTKMGYTFEQVMHKKFHEDEAKT